MNPSGQDNVLGTANVKILLRQLAIPAITAQVVNVLYNVVDRMYIGHIPDIGALALTGVGVCMPIIMLITAFAALVSMGSAPRASVLMGRSDNEEAHYTLGNSFIMLIIIALVLTVFFRRFAEPILMAFGASENTIGYAMDYMRIYTLGTIFVQFALGLNAFITAQGFAKIVWLPLSLVRSSISFLTPFSFSVSIWVSKVRLLPPSFLRQFPLSGYCAF